MIVVVVVGGIAGVVAVRDAAYANDALPGVAVREVDTDRDRLVSIDGKKLPGGGGVLAVDVAATRAAALAAGRDSLWTRVRQLVDPSAPEIVVDPVLRPTAAADELLAELERRAKLTRPAAAQIAMRGRTPQVTPARPGRTIDRDAFLSLLSQAVVAGAAGVEAPLRREPARARHRRRRGSRRNRASAHQRTRRADLRRPGGRLAGAEPARTPAPLRAAPRPLRGQLRPRAARPGGPPRTPAVAHARRQRSLPRRGQERGDQAVEARPRRERESRARPGHGSRLLGPARRGACPPGDAAGPDDARGATSWGSASRSRASRPTWASPRQPDPQRAADGALHRRHAAPPGRDVLLQRLGRAAHERARLPRGPDDHRLAAPALDRRRRLPDRDDALQQRLGARPADRGAAQPQLLHLPLSDGARRHRLLGRPRLRASRTT